MSDHTSPLLEQSLLLHGVVDVCGDCHDERLFVPVDSEPGTGVAVVGEFCCTSCGAAVLIDPLLAVSPGPRRQPMCG